MAAAALLILSGLVAASCGVWRGYAAARLALAPMLRDGDPTRALVEAHQPLHARPRVRLAVRHVLVATLWLCVAMYGLLLLAVGVAVRG